LDMNSLLSQLVQS